MVAEYLPRDTEESLLGYHSVGFAPTGGKEQNWWCSRPQKSILHHGLRFRPVRTLVLLIHRGTHRFSVHPPKGARGIGVAYDGKVGGHVW